MIVACCIYIIECLIVTYDYFINKVISNQNLASLQELNVEIIEIIWQFFASFIYLHNWIEYIQDVK